MKTRKFILIIGLLSGIASVIIYLSHIIIGGVLWRDYNHMTQNISDLTAIGSPNFKFLNNLTMCSRYLAFILSVALLNFLGRHVNKIAKAGLSLFCAMCFCSSFGLLLFPYNRGGDSFQTIMYSAITFLTAVGFLGSSLITGIGFSRMKNYKKLGLFSVFCGVIIIISSAGKRVVAGIGIPISGLLDRISVVTFQVWIFIVSIYFLSYLLSRKAVI